MRTAIRDSIFVLLIAAVAAAAGCLGGNDNPGDKLESTIDVSGTWEGFASGGEELRFELTQDVLAFSGIAVVDGVAVSMSGSVDGKSMTGTLATDPPRTFKGSVSFDSMSGTFRDLTGNIISNFSAVRTETVDSL